VSDPDVLVIGGGISGLSAAWWLARAGAMVEVWERADRPGGKIATHRKDGYLLEEAATLMLNYRPEVTQMLTATGLQACRQSPAARARYLLDDGRLIRLPRRGIEMLTSSVWPWWVRLGLLAEPFIPRGGHEDETVSAFITRRLGRELLERAIEPFLAATQAADPDQTNARMALPRLTALEQRYGSLTLGVLVHKLLRRRTAYAAETFSFRPGMAALTDTLAQQPGLRFRGAHQAEALAPDAGGWRARARCSQGERTVRARQVILSTPAPAAAGLVDGFDPELGRLLGGVAYAPLVVVHLGFDRAALGHPLDGLGFLVPRREGLSLTGNQWLSSLFPNRAPEGKVLLSAYVGGSRAPECCGWDEARIVACVLRRLTPLLGIRADPEMVCLHRHAQALPLYQGDFPHHMDAVAARLAAWPGLNLVANYRGGISTRDRIVEGRATAELVFDRLGIPRTPAPVDVSSVGGVVTPGWQPG